MESKSVEETPGILYWEIGLACAKDEAFIDMEQGSAVAVGYNEEHQATVRSYFEIKDGERKVWHSIGLVDKSVPTKFRFCKISESNEVFYADSKESLRPVELSMKDFSNFATVLFMIQQLEQVEWLPQAQIGEAESELPRFNL